MRVLLDECLPRRLRREIAGHQVVTAQELGHSGKKNGDLLRAVAREMEAMLGSILLLVAHDARVSPLVVG